MYVEENIEALNQAVEDLTNKVTDLEQRGNEEWVSAKDLAKIMGCSANTVYIKIRSGEIYASRLLGSPKIPMSQFYETVASPIEKPKKQLSIKDRIFG